MKQNNTFQEVKTMHLQIVTPCNIGSGEMLMPKDYFFDKKTVYFVDHYKLHKFIYEHKLLEEYEKYLENGKTTKNLLAWFKNDGYNFDDVKHCVISSVAAEHALGKEKGSVNMISAHIKDVYGHVYIPGSSIKGAIRTAILFHLLEENKQLKEKFWSKVYDAFKVAQEKYPHERFKEINCVNGYLKRIQDDMEQSLLHKLDINDKNVKQNNVLRSVMRGVLVGDAALATEEKLAFLQKYDLVFDKDGKLNDKALPLFRECVLPSTAFTFELKLDLAMTECIGLHSIDELLTWVQEFYDFVYEIQKQAFGREKPELFALAENVNMFLGSNTGFLTKTLFAALAPNMREAVNLIKVFLDFSFSKHKHSIKDKHISPRAFKATSYNGKILPMGLARLEKI